MPMSLYQFIFLKNANFLMIRTKRFHSFMLLVFVFMVQIPLCQYKQTILFESSSFAENYENPSKLFPNQFAYSSCVVYIVYFGRVEIVFSSNFFNVLPNEFVDFILKHCYAVKTFSFK